jgi:hypothetical protein
MRPFVMRKSAFPAGSGSIANPPPASGAPQTPMTSTLSVRSRCAVMAASSFQSEASCTRPCWSRTEVKRFRGSKVNRV